MSVYVYICVYEDGIGMRQMNLIYLSPVSTVICGFSDSQNIWTGWYNCL